MRAAQAAECARDQAHFWDYHDRLFQSWAGKKESTFDESSLVGFARELGLDIASFNACLDGRQHLERLEEDMQAALGLNVESVPTVFINEQRVRGLKDYETYRGMIEEELGKSR